MMDDRLYPKEDYQPAPGPEISADAYHIVRCPREDAREASNRIIRHMWGLESTFGERPMMRLAVAGVLLASVVSASAQKLTVTIVNRQDGETDYAYVVPGHFNSQSNSTANCNAGDTNVHCSGSTTTNGTVMPAQQVSYHVRGATFTLQLPDGRAAVVNCESKFKERMAGPRGNHRSCRMPLVDEIRADFHGDNAKLEWVVSLDGKKTQSETYKILAILGKPKSEQK